MRGLRWSDGTPGLWNRGPALLPILRQFKHDQTDVGPLLHVGAGQKHRARVQGYGLLRVCAGQGPRLRRPGILLRETVLTMDRLDEFIDTLQHQIFEEAKEALGEKGFDRWRNPKWNGRMDSPDGYGRVTGECGDTMEIYLKFENNRVSKASYFTDGCASSMVSGSFAAELTLGRNPDELTDITAETVLNAIGRLPEKDLHCATLAARTVQEALTHYMSGLVTKAKE
jgi:nitrogen fixation NifU-like protein